MTGLTRNFGIMLATAISAGCCSGYCATIGAMHSGGALLGRLFAGFYARWCVGRMVADTAKVFSSPTGVPSAA